jgi:hypothetical protein
MVYILMELVFLCRLGGVRFRTEEFSNEHQLSQQTAATHIYALGINGLR